MAALDKNSDIPLHKQLRDILQAKLEQGEYSVGQQIPTTAELCEAFDVSLTTVRRAVTDLIAEGFLKGAPGRGTYVAPKGKAYQHQPSGRLVGVVFTEMANNPFYMEIFRGIESALSAHAYMPIAAASDGNVDKEHLILEELRQKGIRGVALTPVAVGRSPSSDEFLRDLVKGGLPIVFVDRQVPGLALDFVTSDNETAGYEVTRYLINLGHRRIGLLQAIDVSTIRERTRGYERALREARIGMDALVVKRSSAESQYEDAGYRNALELLNLADPPTALFACNDPLALGAYRACYELGLAIPDDVSVVGFDDLNYAASLFPPLTTVRQEKYEMGRRAGELLLDRIDGVRSPPETVALGCQLVERRSCMRPRSAAGRQAADVTAGGVA